MVDEKLRQEYSKLRQELEEIVLEINKQIYGEEYYDERRRVMIALPPSIDPYKLIELKCPGGKYTKCTEPPYQEEMKVQGEFYVCVKCGLKLNREKIDRMKEIVRKIEELKKNV